MMIYAYNDQYVCKLGLILICVQMIHNSVKIVFSLTDSRTSGFEFLGSSLEADSITG